ncbi:MAG: LuxR C-terminal-related transcriptional regulator [Caldilineaceae bacterium]
MIDDLTLNTSKLHPPTVTTALIVRPRLVEQLQRGLAGPLTLVCAPAGYGKTTLVSAYLARAGRTPRPAAWLSIDEQDSELVVFVRYFCAAVRTLFPGACPHTLSLLNAPSAPHAPPLAALVAALSNELVDLPREFVLVLDDYHAISGTAVAELLAGLTRHWPRTLHLVLITRRNPLLPLVSLRAKGQLTEIRTRDLQFTPPEAAEYLAQELGAAPSPSLLNQLMEQTEGWIVGLHLALLALQNHPPQARAGVAAQLLAVDANLAAFLLGELLDQQPPDVLAFMLKTSILDRFCAPQCEYVVERGPGERPVRECIDYLQRTNLLLVALDDQQDWYRYHHLLEEFLRPRALATWGQERVNTWHRRAAEWLLREELIDEAIRHALAAGDLDLTGRAMERGLCAVLNRPDPPALRRWLDLLPVDFRRSRPGLLLIEALVLHFAYRYGELAALLPQIEALMAQPSQGASVPCSGEEELARGQVLVLRASIFYFDNQPAAGIAAAQDALRLLPHSWSYLRGLSLYWLGMNGQVSGQAMAVARELWSHYVTAPVKSNLEVMAVLETLCTLAFLAGRLERVHQMARLLLEQSRLSGIVTMEGWAHYWLGLVHYEWNELATAAAHLNEVAHLRYSLNSYAARDGLLCLARLQAALGDLVSAGQTLDLLHQYDLDVLGYETPETGALRAQLRYQYDDPAAALRWAGALTQPVPDQPLPQFYNAHYTKACILLAGGGPAQRQEGIQLLSSLADVAERTYHTRLQIALLAVRALVLRTQGQEQAAHTTLAAALALAEPGGFIRTFLDLGPRMQELIASEASKPDRGAPAPIYIRRILVAFAAPTEVRSHALSDAAAARDRVPPNIPDNSTSSGGPLSAHTPDLFVVDVLDMARAEPLTAREMEILVLIGKRLSDKEIAHTLEIATSTVHRHVANLYGKLGVNRRWDAFVKAQALGMLPR